MKRLLALGLVLLMALSLVPTGIADSATPLPVTFYSSGYIGVYADEQAYIDNVEQKFYDDTGILLDITLLGTSHEESYQFISTKLAGGELDFVKSASPAFMQQMASEGYYLPLDDLLNEYGQRMLGAVNPLGFGYGVIDGKNYLMPYIGDYSMYVCTWVRWDLFEDSGYTEYPATVSEMADMMKKVMADHPEKNLVGITSRYPNWPWQHSMTTFYPVGDNSYNFRSCDEDGNYLDCIYGNNLPIYFNEPDYPAYLHQMVDWYQSGVIHNEVWTMDQTQYDALLGQGRLFVVSDGWTFQQTADRRAGIDPDYPLAEGQEPEDWRLLTHVLRDNGSPMVWAAGLEGLQTGYGAIVDGCPYAKEIVQFCDWVYSGIETYQTIAWGIEGQHWNWDEDGFVVRVKDEAGSNTCSGAFTTLCGNFYLDYSMDVSTRYYGTEWKKVFGEKNKDWIGFFQDHSTLAFSISDTLAQQEMQKFAGECIVEILTTKIGVEEGLDKLRKGLDALGYQEFYTEYNEQYKAGMIAKYGEDYVHHK